MTKEKAVDRVEEIRQRALFISKGPWTVNYTKMDGAIVRWHIAGAEFGSLYPICEHVIEVEPEALEQHANVEFIINAPNDISWLLSQLAAKEKADPQTDSPILKIFVEEDGSISACDFYAPGLPPGEHDLWCVPVQIKR